MAPRITISSLQEKNAELTEQLKLQTLNAENALTEARQIADNLRQEVESARAEAHIAGVELAATKVELDTARADLEAARAEVQVARAAAAAATQANNAAPPAGGNGANGPVMIEKPHGKFNLRTAMGLANDRVQYRAIQRTIHELVLLAALDWKVDYRKQDPIKLANLFQAANQDHPILATFVNNWATAELIKQFLQNRRKYAYHLGILPSPAHVAQANH